MSKKEEIVQELAKKYNLDLKKLEKEQLKLAGQLEIKDAVDFSEIENAAGIDNVFLGNKIISAVVVIDRNFEVIEKEYFIDKLRFPYISGFRAYRELPAMLNAFHKLEQKPDLFFVRGHGLSHPRLGLASHFSLSTGIPTIGITEKLFIGCVEGEDIFLNNKKAGKAFQSKKGSKHLYVSPGNLISIKTAFKLTKKFIKFPHKLPEPLYLAHKFAKRVKGEIGA